MIGSTLSNPVVFFTLGNCNDFAPLISQELEYYVQGAGFINVSTPEDEFVKSEIERVWHKFLESGVSKSDILRANFFIYSDETALALPNLLLLTEKYFATLYPAGVLIDVYCLLDDENLLTKTECRANVMQMLDAIQGDGIKVYLLSSLSSTNAFAQRDTAAQTIALLTLFKDCSPNLHVSEADASRYNEFFFWENCAARGGEFLTAGSSVLAVPRDALKALIMSEILAYGRDRKNEKTENQLEEPVLSAKRLSKSIEYLQGLVIPDANYKDQLTRGQWLARLFGERLEKIINDHEYPETVNSYEFSPRAANLYSLLRQVEDIHYKTATEAAEAVENELRHAKEALAVWLEQRPDFSKGSPEAATRRLSPVKNQELFPYVLAAEFMKKQLEIQYIEKKTEILQNRQSVIACYLEKLKECQSQVEDAIFGNVAQINGLNEAFQAFTERKSYNTSDYFRGRLLEYICDNKEKMESLAADMTEALLNGEFPAFEQSLDSYIELNVLSSPQFAEPTYMLLQELTGEDISAAISEWALQHRHFGVRLKMGYAQLYSEANLFMSDSKTAFEVKRQYEARGLGRMNIFARKGADRVAVLYHAGAFNLDELYYHTNSILKLRNVPCETVHSEVLDWN